MKPKTQEAEISFLIEQGVPIPVSIRKTKANVDAKTRSTLCFPFPKMKIGDSFFFPGGSDFSKAYMKINNSVQRYISRHPSTNFLTRTVEEKGENGIRVWRIQKRIGRA